MNLSLLSTILAILVAGGIAAAQDNEILTFDEAKKLADQGDAYGEAIVAFHYSVGWQTEKNTELAVKYALSSTQKGHPLGAFRLGAILRSGESVPKNEVEGLELQKKSFQGLKNMSGNPYAITALGVMLFQGKVLPENKNEAARLYKAAADMGFAPAQFNYAMCAEAGHGVPKNQRVATEFLWKALVNEYTLAIKHLGLECGSGVALVKNLEAPFDRRSKDDASQMGVRAVVQRSPNEYAIASAVSADGDRLAVVDSSIGIWELSSGRLLSEFPAPQGEIVCTFFRGEDLVVCAEDTSGAGVLVFLNAKTGTSSRSDIPLPAETKAAAYCAFTDSLLCVSKENAEGGEPENLHLLFIKSGTQKKLPHPSFTHGAMIPRAMFDAVGNILLLNISPEPPYYGVSEICIINQAGNIIDRSNRGANDFKKKASTALGLPEHLLSSAADGHFGDAFGIEVQEESGNYSNERLSFMRSLHQWNCPQPRVVVKLRRPAEVWSYDSKGEARITKLIGSNLVQYQYVAADTDSLGFLAWGVQGFAEGVHNNIPYVFRLDTLTHSVVSLPPGTTLLNARKSTAGKWKCAVGRYEIKHGEHRLGLSEAVVDRECAMVIAGRLGFCDPYEVTDATIFNDYQSVIDSRPVVESNSNEHPLRSTFHGSLSSCQGANGETNFSLYSNSSKLIVNKGVWTEGGFFSQNSTLVLWNSAGERYILGRLSSQAKLFTASGNPMLWRTPENAAEAIIGIYPTAKGAISFTTKNMYFLDGNSQSITSVWRVPNTDQYTDINSNYVRPSEMADYDAKSGFAYFVGKTGSINMLKLRDGQHIEPVVCINHNTKGMPVLFDPKGAYLSLARDFDGIHFSDGEKTYPFEQFDLRLNRPDIVLERLGAPDEAIAIAKKLRDKRLKRMGVTEDMLQPDFHLPKIEIVGELPSSTADSELAIKLKASHSKYPLDRLRVYVNNVPVNGKEGELLRDSKSQALERTIPIKLAAGRNKIQISVLNSAGAESLYANAEVTCTAQRPKPTLYAVAMGISEYANPDWNLKYAAKDARDIIERVKARSGSSYGEIKKLLLIDGDATKESLGKIREFLSKATVDDTVLMFVAGHGLLDNKYDYYFGTSDIDFSNPSEKGIAFEEFDDLLASLPSLKKSLLIDTCHAGELDEEEKQMLASAQTSPNQVVAMLPTGARGMNIKPIEGARGKSEWYDRLQGLFVDLRRGSGSTILSSSAGAEYALESSEQKNGLFTYAVLEALDGKEGADANKDGSVTMSELADYVKSRVATLTNNKQSPNVRRVNLEGDFILAVLKSTIGSSKIISFDIALSKANAGDAYAQAVVSIYYGLGIGCEQNFAKSKEYAMLSAKQQNPIGIYRLAEMRESGEGMEKNTEQAAQLMQKAKAGLQKLASDPYALTALATIYERESPDSPKIREVLTKAADIGYEPAADKLSKLEGSKY